MSDEKDKKKKRSHDYYVKNREYLIERASEYRKNNYDKYKEYQKNYFQTHKDAHNQRVKMRKQHAQQEQQTTEEPLFYTVTFS